MRATRLSRTVVVAASMSVATAALVATPARAATSTGITQEDVLIAAHLARTELASDQFNGYSASTRSRLDDIVNRSCQVENGSTIPFLITRPVAPGGSVDGLLIRVSIRAPGGPDEAIPVRDCQIGALATTDANFSLSGTAVLTIGRFTPFTPRTLTAYPSTLSGDVFVTAVGSPSGTGVLTASGDFTASGAAQRGTTTSTTTEVADIKTSKEKTAAKATYVKRLKSAKDVYRKALAKAGSSSRKKAAAKQAYLDRRAAAKDRYRTAVSGSKVVTATTTTYEGQPFSVKAFFGDPI